LVGASFFTPPLNRRCAGDHKPEAAGAVWKTSRADPDWIAAKKASETNGLLTAKVL
jgi:hypothetical protein